ncbi:MAG: M20/M25/M40 family metallo-hydrolase [Candidatus Tectomicrobia bacterium]|nr:M20/M25/M40 family metallo-hydrolase [Candidatus Tectomicrobia bacterium]
MLLLPAVLPAQVRHNLQVVLQPESHQLHVTDTITLPATSQQTWTFRLHAGLNPTVSDPAIRLSPQPNNAGDAPPKIESYTLTLPPGRHSFTLHYEGAIYHPLPASGAAYARGFQTTPGLIAAEGTYLSATTVWYPQFANHLLTFALQVQVPPNWDAVSQGERTQYERQPGHTRVKWEEAQPQEDIYLIAAPFTAYEQMTDRVRAMAFLRTPDPALAAKYLETTGQYLAMYEELIGPYPYRKFALVENFWQTGYGMPSFTLLGSKVIRLPFILHSSYPHEILHNWWGNSVYIDATDGNWAEGLTAYLADHLIKEQRGIAVNYRRDELQKYADYVTSGQDFPITAFRTRHDPVTQAVGYGKTMMLFHMLRQQIGNDVFIQALQTFFRTYRFRRVRFTDLIQVFADTAGIDVQPFYQQWIARPGAPEIRVRDAQVQHDGAGYRLMAQIEQVQPEPAYTLQLPIAITLDGVDHAHTTRVEMRDAQLTLDLRLPDRPQRLDIDAQFDLFRRLHRDEIPPALSQIFGATNVLLLLPASAPEAVRQGYRRLAQVWQRPGSAPFEIRLDTDISAWPTDRSVWLFGWNNRWRSQVATALTSYPATLQPDQVQVEDTALSRSRHSVVLTARNPANPAHALGWIATDNAEALPGLGRKLPHYGKYSYLGFSGDEPTNIAKGQWPVVRSPLSVILPSPAGAPQTDGSEVRIPVPRAKLPTAFALASLPPLFSAERMQQTIRYLASDAMRGRGFGAPELDQAADFLVAQFRAAGLQPGGDQPQSYIQAWPARGGKPARNVTLKNIVGIIPGQRSAWDGQNVVVGAHYDHLGLGWPDVHQGDSGKLHPGADDNASGVAVLLELARVLGKDWKPDRTVVFVAFSGEEAGRLGSQHYVTHTTRWPVAKSIGMINFDTVGRLGQNQLQVLGTASAREWPHIFRGAGFVTGVPVQPIAQEWGASDQRSFLDAGIPAVQLSSGPHLDYHRPTDTIDHIDPAGLVKISAVAREAIVYLAGRDEPLSSTLGNTQDSRSTPSKKPAPSRRVSLGTVPDFAYDGQGYRISDIVPGSPAAHAGLQAGDVIVQVDTTPVADIRAFANALRTLQPGATIALTIRRGNAEQIIQTQLTAR